MAGIPHGYEALPQRHWALGPPPMVKSTEKPDIIHTGMCWFL